ncbi:hypothetical protein LJC72_13075, partial [Bacteroides sp. OttesenSCG-928-D19]|nr:hypothetical protein [Bacteroides sp. OttesenSCG-928-D19]
TEHNTPAMEPIKLTARGNKLLTERLKQINYNGACVIAAHQERIRNGEPGYTGADGQIDTENRNVFIQEGDRLIQKIIQG